MGAATLGPPVAAVTVGLGARIWFEKFLPDHNPANAWLLPTSALLRSFERSPRANIERVARKEVERTAHDCLQRNRALVSCNRHRSHSGLLGPCSPGLPNASPTGHCIRGKSVVCSRSAENRKRTPELTASWRANQHGPFIRLGRPRVDATVFRNSKSRMKDSAPESLDAPSIFFSDRPRSSPAQEAPGIPKSNPGLVAKCRVILDDALKVGAVGPVPS